MSLLTWLLLIPLCGAVLLFFFPAHKTGLIRYSALVTAAATLLLSCWIAFQFDAGYAGMQFEEFRRWNPKLGTSFSLGVDGFSLPMVLLAALLVFVSLLASRSIRLRVKGYYILVLLLEAAVLGVFLARDWSLFYVFWEFTLIPLFFLINRWGGENRNSASLNFVLYTMGGSVFMLISLLVLFDYTPDHSFSMAAMSEGAQVLSADTQTLIFLGFLIGFGVKMPIFPLHGWLPLAHVEAPSPVSILLSGILLKMGSYGLIRAAEMLPDAISRLQDTLALLAIINLIYGGLLAWRQVDLKKMIAYSSVSHMGVVLLGIAALNTAGLTGAVYQMVAHGLVAGALFLLIGLLYERTKTRNVAHYSSLVKTMPRFAFFTVLALIGAVGMPGTAGFVAELHVVVGGFEEWGWLVVLVSVGVLVSATYAIRTIGRLFTGPVRPQMRDIPDLGPSEVLAASVLGVGIVLLGIFPAPLLYLMHTSVEQLSEILGRL